jgi:RHS repeat-associated protein
MTGVRPPNLQGTQTNLVTNEYTTAADAPTPVGWVKKQTFVDGGVYQFAYNVTNGKSTQTHVTDPRGYVRRVTFNPDGYTLEDRRALNQPEEQFDANDRPITGNFVTSYRNTQGNVTNTEYDSLGRVWRVTRLPGTVDEARTTYSYDPKWPSEIATITDPLNHTTTFTYDARGNRESVTDALNHTVTLTYNLAGQITSLTDPLQHTTTYDYVGPDLVKITDPLGRITQRTYDAAGRMLAETDPMGQTTRFTYDKVNHATQVLDAQGSITTFEYDTAGRFAAVTDALTHRTAYAYDVLGRIASRTDPLSKTETLSYDLNGNPSQRTDRKGQVTTRSYDALNRLRQITYADTSTITYTYDSGNHVRTIVDSIGGTKITRDYDDLDRLIAETTPQGTASYTYDKADRLSTMTISGQPTVVYGYDDANRLRSVTQGASTVTVMYDDANRRSLLSLPNGISVAYTYDDGSQLTELTYTLGQATLGTLTYDYDLVGRRTNVAGSWARVRLPQPVISTSHDAANRLTQWGGSTLTYDSNGNLVSDGPTSYGWDSRNRLATLSGGLSGSFAYDATGRRTTRAVAGQSASFLYNGANVAQELNAGVPSANLLTGGIDERFVRTVAGGQAEVFLNDVLGSTVALADGNGAVQTRYAYEPFGATGTEGQNSTSSAQYTGRENDLTSLYYYRARYYAPALHRFISEDPIGFRGGTNLYAYVNNGPLNASDPFGLVAWACKYSIATVNSAPIAGPGAAMLWVECTSECVSGQRVWARLFGSLVGASGGPFPVGATIESTIALRDGFSQPDAQNLAGPVLYASFGGATPWFGWTITTLKLGQAGGHSVGDTRGLDLGLDTYGGLTSLISSRREKCCD